MGDQRVKWSGDVLVIGGGIVGTAIAHALAAYELRVALVEKGADLACGTSKANSGIIHPGYNADPETLKGRLHLRAVQLVREICRELDVPVRWIGALVIAYTPEEAVTVREMYGHAQTVGIPVEMVEGEALQRMEPAISPEALTALHAPTAGVISPYEWVFALGENAVLNGVEFYFDAEVTAVRDVGPIREVVAGGELFQARVVVNAAGLYADEVALMAGDEIYPIIPRKGEYLLFDQRCGGWVRHVLFPVPTAVSKGILVTPTADGNLLVGPTAVGVSDKEDRATTREGMDALWRGGRRVLEQLRQRDVINAFAGLRAVIRETEDYWIRPSERCQGVIHVAGIQSPGLTAAPAIAEYVADMIGKTGLVEMRAKESFAYRRKAPVRFGELSREEQAALIERDPRYGQVICRCEHVTEGEVIDAITRPLGARTVGGVKRRVRAGMGRCQGGFCGPRIVELIARYAGIDKLEVTKEGGKSELLTKRTR